MKQTIIEIKSFEYAIRIVNLYRYLCDEKKEYILSKQLLKSGTSIGANVSEAQRGQSKNDFYAKYNIALKEAMKKLNERERKIINLRFYKNKTQMEIAEEIGISQAQVSRLEKGALERMRKQI